MHFCSTVNKLLTYINIFVANYRSLVTLYALQILPLLLQEVIKPLYKFVMAYTITFMSPCTIDIVYLHLAPCQLLFVM